MEMTSLECMERHLVVSFREVFVEEGLQSFLSDSQPKQRKNFSILKGDSMSDLVTPTHLP